VQLVLMDLQAAFDTVDHEILLDCFNVFDLHSRHSSLVISVISAWSNIICMVQTALSIDGVSVSPVTSVRNLGSLIDSDLELPTYVQPKVYLDVSLRPINYVRSATPCRRPRSSHGRSAMVIYQESITENGVLIGLPTHLVRLLQSGQNAAARLIFGASITLHIYWSACTGCASRIVVY